MAQSLREVVSFGRYDPLFRIASGGMAEVYAARIRGEAGFQKLVAVKRMHPHLANDAGFVDMFLNEARLAAHIASPHVVQTLDLGRGSDGSLYIVMELVVGLSLARLWEERPEPMPPGIAIELIAQAAQGLDDAHDAMTPAGDTLGLVHRDVSPHNILLGLDGRARVTDFGIAHAIHRPREETNVRELKGKFAYMSPEQTRVKPLDRRTDVFSLGIVLWESLVGRRLFAERDPAGCIQNVRRKTIPPPQQMMTGIPPSLGQVVLKALARDREQRFNSAADFAMALRMVGREAYGELPSRKQIISFIKSAGGEELDRLQRLIRMGTEGADVDAIEKIQPGATRILTEEASGVARLGTGAAQVEEGPKAGPVVDVVSLSPDDEVCHTMTVDLASGTISSTNLFNPAVDPDMATAILAEDELEGEPTRAHAHVLRSVEVDLDGEEEAGPTRDLRAPVGSAPAIELDSAVLAGNQIHTSSVEAMLAPEVPIAAPPAQYPPHARTTDEDTVVPARRGRLGLWVVFSVVAAGACVGAVVAGLLLASAEPDPVPIRTTPTVLAGGGEGSEGSSGPPTVSPLSPGEPSLGAGVADESTQGADGAPAAEPGVEEAAATAEGPGEERAAANDQEAEENQPAPPVQTQPVGRRRRTAGPGRRRVSSGSGGARPGRSRGRGRTTSSTSNDDILGVGAYDQLR